MLDVPVYTTNGQEVTRISIDETHLGGKVREKLLKQAIVMYLARRRQGTAHTKNRSSVRGSTRKLYRQKGTGNARMGAIRTPIRRGGGRTFAKSPRDFAKDMPKRMRRLACYNALLARILAKDVLVLDALGLESPKTKQLYSALTAMGASDGCLLALEKANEVIYKSGRNIPRTDIRPVNEVNAYDLLRRKKVIFTKDAFEKLKERAAKDWGG